MAPRPAEWSRSRKYGVVIDAGSSGSRVQVYSWINPEVDRQQRKADGKSLDVLSRVQKGVEHGDEWHSRVEPGISTLAGDVESVGAYLRPMLDFATSVIPGQQLPDTPIYLLATAGMRLLPEDDRDALLAEACAYIRTYPFKLPDCSEAVRVITGEEEGLYGWIAVNYLMDGFDKHEHASTSSEISRDSSTYGFLDMGGASTQIAFEPSESERIKHADNLLDVTLKLLSGKTVRHPVFVTTWLGFGTNQARERYIDSQIGVATGETIYDPCLPKSLVVSDRRHPGYALTGTGDFEQCVRRTGPLLNKEVECLDDPCLFNGVHVPPIDFSVNHFIGISEYWYSTQDVWSMGGVYDFVEFERNAVDFCGRPWDEIVAEHEAGTRWKPSVELSRLETQCFKAAWIINILHEGIGIPRIIDPSGEGDGRNQTAKATAKGVQKGLLNRPPSFQSVNEVGDVAVSWTLGKMVLEVARGELSDEVPVMSTSRGFSNWRAHFPKLSGNVRETISEVKEKPVPLAGVIIFAVVAWVYCVSPSAARRRKHLFSHARKKSDYGLVRAEEDASSDSSSGGPSDPTSSSSLSSKRRSSSPGMIAKVVSPVRHALYRLSAMLRRSTTSKPNTGLLPTIARLPSHAPSGNGEHVYRPTALRHVQSQPFLRSGPPPLSSGGPAIPMSQIQHGNSATFYLDAPDVSDRVLARSHSAAAVVAPPPPPSSSSVTAVAMTTTTTGTTTPPSYSTSSISRPTTPGGTAIMINRSVSAGNLAGGRSSSRLALSSTIAPSSSSSMSSQKAIPTMSTSSSTTSIAEEAAVAGGPPASSLSEGVWASLAHQQQHQQQQQQPNQTAGIEGLSSTTPSTPTGGGGAKLRTTLSSSLEQRSSQQHQQQHPTATRSASSSMVNVRDSYFASRAKYD